MTKFLKFRIFYTNFSYFADMQFDTAENALEYGKSKGFEFSVYDNESCNPYYYYSPLYGTVKC